MSMTLTHKPYIGKYVILTAFIFWDSQMKFKWEIKQRLCKKDINCSKFYIMLKIGWNRLRFFFSYNSLPFTIMQINFKFL